MAFTNTMFEFPQMIRGDASPDKVPVSCVLHFSSLFQD